MLDITSAYAGLGALILVFLSLRVIRYRRGNKISVGDGGDEHLLRRMRAQANCAEYLPIGLLLLALVEAGQASSLVVHTLGFMLLAGRFIHAWGFSASPQIMTARVAGMVLSLTMILLSAVWLFLHAVF